MKALYVASLETVCGKTALCLGLARRFIADGYRVGYMKPVTLRRRTECLVDEDAAFAQATLGLVEPLEVISPVSIDRERLEGILRGQDKRDYASELRRAYVQASQAKDLMLLEGSASMRDGYLINLPMLHVARMLHAPVLAIVRWQDGAGLIDDCLTMQVRLGEALLGLVINAVPSAGMSFTSDVVKPYLEAWGITVLGILPQQPQLQTIRVGDLRACLDGEMLCLSERTDVLVESLMVGAMTVDAALVRFQRQPNKAVITGGDRTDIQLVALETSTRALVLTGNQRPNIIVVKRAEAAGVPIILTRLDTLGAVEAVQRAIGKIRMGQSEQLARFEALLADHLDFERLYTSLRLG